MENQIMYLTLVTILLCWLTCGVLSYFTAIELKYVVKKPLKKLFWYLVSGPIGFIIVAYHEVNDKPSLTADEEYIRDLKDKIKNMSQTGPVGRIGKSTYPDVSKDKS